MNNERNTLYDAIKQRGLLREQQSTERYNGKTCKVMIGSNSSESINNNTTSNSSSSQFDLSIKDLLGYLETYHDDSEMIYQIIYYLTMIIVEPLERLLFKELNGIESIITILKDYQSDLSLVKCCCSCLNNAGSSLITKEIVKEIEFVQQLYPFDFFLKTVLVACYANYARFHSDMLVFDGSIERIVTHFQEKNMTTDLELALLAAFSNISRNSELGQLQCISFKIHEMIIDKLMNEEVCDDYWKVACNALGCLTVNMNGNECKEVVEYAYHKGFIDKLLSIVHHPSIENEPIYDRLLTCLAKFCVLVPLFHIPQLHWLCYESIKQQDIPQRTELSHLPISLQIEFQKKLFTCHVCKIICDPFVFRSIRFNDTIILMSYCSFQCWFKRHENR